MSVSTGESGGSTGPANRRRLFPLLAVGCLLIAIVFSIRLLVTDSFDRWRASRMTDVDAAKAASAANTSYPYVIEWARRQEVSSHFAEAERIYARAMELGPTRVDAWNGFVRTAVAAGDWGKADITARKTVELWPDNADSRFLFASILGRTFRTEQAARQLEAGLNLEPSKGEAWKTLGDLRMQMKNSAAAVEAYKRALVLTPRATHLRARLGEALEETGRYDEAVSTNKAALTEDPNDMNARFSLGKALVLRAKAEDRAEALLELNRVAHFSSSKARAYYLAAHVWFRESDYGNATQALEHAYDENPFNADVLAMLVDVYQRSGKKDSADRMRKNLERAQSAAVRRKALLDQIGHDQSLVPNLIELGKTDLDAGNPVESEGAFNAAILLEPGNPEAMQGIKRIRGKIH